MTHVAKMHMVLLMYRGGLVGGAPYSLLLIDEGNSASALVGDDAVCVSCHKGA